MGDETLFSDEELGLTITESAPDEQSSQGEAPLDTKSEDVSPPASTAPEPKPNPVKAIKGISGREVHVMTRPWDSMHNQWVTDVFRVKQRVGWRKRFADKNNVARKKEEGWRVANCEDYGIEREEGQIDSVVTRRGMILMEMPEELAEQRDAYFKTKTDMQTAKPDTELKNALRKTEHGLGGSVELERLDKPRHH